MGIRDRFSSARAGGTSGAESAGRPAAEPAVTEPAAGGPVAAAPAPSVTPAAAAPAAATTTPSTAAPEQDRAPEEPTTSTRPAEAGRPATAEKPAKPAQPAKPAKAEKPATAPRERADLAVWRSRVSQLLWTAFVLLALVLAVAALLVAIDANEDNGLVDFVLRAADAVDLGVFSRENGVREFTGDNAETKNALFNWGLGAVVYLLLGRLVERLVRPGR